MNVSLTLLLATVDSYHLYFVCLSISHFW